MNHELTISLDQMIRATAGDVWNALTDPEKIRQYFYGTEAVSDWEVGRPIRFKGEWDGTPYEDKGMILQKIDGQRLQYSYWSSMSGMEDIPQNYATVTYQLEEKEEGKTLLTVHQKGFKDEEARKHSVTGWNTVLDNLKSMLEEEQS